MATRGRPQKEWQNQLPASLFEDTAFCTLGPLQRLLLVALIARADRHGRGSAKASLLCAAVFDGLRVTADQVETMLHELVDLMRGSQYELAVYTVDRNDYYAFRRWHEFQNIDYVPKTSRYPAPPDCHGNDGPPTPPEGGLPDGSADLPTETGEASATVPTCGEEPVGPEGEAAGETQGSADLPAIERARRSPEYREYEEVCRDGELDRWLAPLAFEQLFAACLERGIEWTVLIEVAREAASAASGKTPNVRYGVQIVRSLPADVKTREQACEYFSRPRPKPDRPGGDKPRGSNVILHRGKEYDDSKIFKRFDDEAG